MSPPRFAGSRISGTYFLSSSANGLLIHDFRKCYVAFSGTYFFFKRSKQEKFGISFYPQAAPVHQMPSNAAPDLLYSSFGRGFENRQVSLCVSASLREKNSGVLFFHLLSYKRK